MRYPYLLGIFLGVSSGSLAGLGAFTFIYARGYSYAANNPTACANCHVMRQHYDTWARSSHHNVAVCNDCHTPHNLVGKLWIKGVNGYHHSAAFTTGRYPDNIRIKPRNAAVTEAACRHCHEDFVAAVDVTRRHGDELSCARCHSTVGHLQ
ncbi:MAG: cytochrome c nitrite reductase small subunit [Armatimonadetes bacterium]|nr:cytochrome c nitrite reductase small subunit [Armatimonadota bacterium]